MPIRDASLYVDVIGHGPPLVLMHGGPGADHWTMLPFQRLADRFTLVFYDHRCNGRSVGAPVSSMTWENLTADADALRERLGYETWAVLGHSFGGQVALEYALRYPERLSDLILMDTGGDSRWTQEHAPELLARRGFSPRKVRLAERFYDGRTAPWEFLPTLMRLGGAYDPHTSFAAAMRTMFAERRTKPRAEAYRFSANHLTKGWTVMDRLGEIRVPDAGHGRARRLPLPARASGAARRGDPERSAADHRARGAQPARRAARRVMEAIREFVPQPARGLRDSGGR